MRLFRQVTMNDELLENFSFNRELAMQAYILEHPEILKLDDMDDIEIHEEETHIKGGGRKGKNNGRVDMVASYSGEYIAIIEFKKNQLVQDSLDQLENYLKQTDELEKLAERVISKEYAEKPKWIGILVGTSIDAGLERKISNGHVCNGTIPIAAITIERFRSATGNVYITTDTYLFKNNLYSKDYTKYEFNGAIHHKNRLVLAIITKYVTEHPNITYDKLREVFPKNLANNGIFATLEEANRIYTEQRRKRHFIDTTKDEPIKLGDGKMIAVSSQWSADNIKDFIKKAKEELKYEIKKTSYTPPSRSNHPAKNKDGKKTGLDKTKYSFNGKNNIGKGKLALAIIQKYVTEHSDITSKKLQEVFPATLTRNGLFETLEKATENYKNDKSKRKRYFIDPDQAIRLQDGVFVVSSQWGIGNLGEIINIAENLGYEITETKE